MSADAYNRKRAARRPGWKSSSLDITSKWWLQPYSVDEPPVHFATSTSAFRLSAKSQRTAFVAFHSAFRHSTKSQRAAFGTFHSAFNHTAKSQRTAFVAFHSAFRHSTKSQRAAFGTFYSAFNHTAKSQRTTFAAFHSAGHNPPDAGKSIDIAKSSDRSRANQSNAERSLRLRP
ncbi:hypothetical protein [Stieleria sedimenti]|uniref:hypothetical protein n=1 Tax=Stieleria sedimenti TaxID=2976331 RepID=UPI00217F3E0C|nr:hypothetical protein [Stieleria sedimenti]